MMLYVRVNRSLSAELSLFDPFQNVGGNLLILNKLPMAWFYEDYSL